jgi:hypothetical protein
MENETKLTPSSHKMDPDAAREQLRLLGYKDGDPVYYRMIVPGTGKARKVDRIFPEIPDQPEGFNAYFVVNGGGHRDEDVTEGKAIFYEHDNLPKEEQISLWQRLQLPDPTLQVDTGGKSVHSYWVFDTPIPISLWRELQLDLIDFSKADPSNKNPSRVMRLAGSLYYPKGGGDPLGVAQIVGKSGQFYSYEALRAAIPSRHKATAQPPTPPTRDGSGIRSLRDDREVARELLRWIPPRRRNTNTYNESWKVFAALVNHFGEAEGLQLAREWSPDDNWEEDLARKAASVPGGTGRRAGFGSLVHIAKQYGYEPKKGSSNGRLSQPRDPDSVGAGDPIQNAGDSRVEFQGLIDRIHEIVTTSENRAVERFRLGKLAQSTKIRVTELRGIYRDYIEAQREAPILSLKDFLAQAPDDRKWLIGGLVPQSTTGIFHAAPGVGKTLFCYELARAVAAGGVWNGFPVHRGKVLIVQTDEPSSETTERLKIMEFGEDATVSANVSVLMTWSFVQIPKLEKWIEDQKPAFVLIDSLTSANRGSQTEESDALYADGLYALRDMADRHGCTVLVIHHSNKAGELRGSTAIDGAVSEVWNLTKPTKEENLGECHRILKIGKSRAGLTGSYLVELDPDSYRWTWHGDYRPGQGSQEMPATSEAAILNHFRRNAHASISPLELAKHGFCGGNSNTASQALARLHRRGLLTRERRVPTEGKWYYVYQLPTPNDSPNDSHERVIRDVISPEPSPSKGHGLMTSDPTPPPPDSSQNGGNPTHDKQGSLPPLNETTTTPGGGCQSPVIRARTQSQQALQPNDKPNDKPNSVVWRVVGSVNQYSGPPVGSRVKLDPTGVDPKAIKRWRAAGRDLPWGQTGTVVEIMGKGSRYVAIVAMENGGRWVVDDLNALVLDDECQPANHAPESLDSQRVGAVGTFSQPMPTQPTEATNHAPAGWQSWQGLAGDANHVKASDDKPPADTVGKLAHFGMENDPLSDWEVIAE